MKKVFKLVAGILTAVMMGVSLLPVTAQAQPTVDYNFFGTDDGSGEMRINPGDYVKDATTIAKCVITVDGAIAPDTANGKKLGAYSVSSADKVDELGSWIFEAITMEENEHYTFDGDTLTISIPCTFSDKCFNNANIKIYAWGEGEYAWIIKDVKFYDANGELCVGKNEPEAPVEETTSGDATDKTDDAKTDTKTETTKPVKTPVYKLKTVKGKLVVYSKGKPVTGKKQVVRVGTKKYAINKKGVVYTNKLSVKIGKEYYKCDKNGVANLRK